jgi:hypothetical protein
MKKNVYYNYEAACSKLFVALVFLYGKARSFIKLAFNPAMHIPRLRSRKDACDRSWRRRGSFQSNYGVGKRISNRGRALRFYILYNIMASLARSERHSKNIQAKDWLREKTIYFADIAGNAICFIDSFLLGKDYNRQIYFRNRFHLFLSLDRFHIARNRCKNKSQKKIISNKIFKEAA